MGASTIVTHMILFIAVLGIASGLLVGLKNFSDNAQSSFNQKSDEFNKQIRTSFEIEVVSYDNNTETTSVYVRNTGETTLKPGTIDIYIDGTRFPRNTTNRTIKVLEDTEQVNPGLWDEAEKLLIKANKKLEDDMTHEVIVTSPYQGRAKKEFST